MSKSVDEVIKLLKEDQKYWSNFSGFDPCYNSLISKDGCLEIERHGNSCCFSIIILTCENNRIPITWFDRFKLEKAVSKWFRKAGLDQLKGTK